jgi:hypothetical protein
LPSENGHFPPLALEEPYDAQTVHPFDAFFAAPAAELSVQGVQKVGPIDTLVIERREDVSKDIPHFLSSDDARRYGSRLRWYRTCTAWVDRARGCIPVRMEWSSRWTLDGNDFPNPVAALASPVIASVEIEQLASGAWYPRSGTITVYSDEEPVREVPGVAELIAGKPSARVRQGLDHTITWNASSVRANVELAEGFFALPFPDGALLLDHRNETLTAVGNRTAVLNRLIGLNGPSGDDQAGPGGRFIWLIAGNLLLFGMIFMVWKLGKRWRGSSGDKGAK